MCLKSIVDRYRKFRERDLIRWRTQLTLHESSALVPQLRARIEYLVNYFDEVIAICKRNRENETFGTAIAKLIQVPQNAKPITPLKTNLQHATDYYDGAWSRWLKKTIARR